MALPLPRLVRPAQHLRTLQRTLSTTRTISTTRTTNRSQSTSASAPASPAAPPTSPFSPRHLLSIADLSPSELTTLVNNASTHKTAIKSTNSVPLPLSTSLSNRTLAILMSKRSTRTRVSLESAITTLGGHPMFLGSNDIQLGVNESLYDTAVVVSSMVSAMIARVHKHEEVADLAKHSSVPVINALSDLFHPLQTLADFLTIKEAFAPTTGSSSTTTKSKSLGLEGLKIAWVGDANNVLFDLAIGAAKLGCEVSVATPRGFGIPANMREIILSQAPPGSTFSLPETNSPEEALKNADVIVTDTWVSMGQEAEKAERLRAFEGFQVTKELIQRGGAKEGWKFMHCLPRHQEEVSDEVFYSQGASLVFKEAENRLWSAVAALEGFVVNGGKIV